MGSAKEYEDENIIWTPAGNPSLLNKEAADLMFPVEEKYRTINVVAVAKGDNLITPQFLKEVKQWEDMVYATYEYTDTEFDATQTLVRPQKGRSVSFQEMCIERYYYPTVGDPFAKVSAIYSLN